MKALFLILIALLLAGCGASPEQLTATAVMAQAQTQTAAPTLTSTATLTPTPLPTFTPTRTPKPTNTATPTPTPAGETVKFGPLEITLLQVETHSHVVPGGYYYYYAKPGYVFIELSVLVRNTEATPMDMLMKHIYIVDEAGDKWFATFGTFKTVEIDKAFNPINIRLTDNVNSGEENIPFEKDTYLRLIFAAGENQTIQFGIQDSPQFTFDIKTK